MKKILFDHLEKTAGTTIAAILRKLYGPEAVSPLLLHEKIGVIPSLFEAFDVAWGHFNLQEEYSFPHQIHHITILRNPMERLISEYYYVRNDTPSAFGPFAEMARSMTLDEALKIRHPALVNKASRFYLKHFSPQFGSDTSDQDYLKHAQHILQEAYQTVLITERLNESIDLLCFDLGIPSTEEAPWERKTSERPGLQDLDAPAQRAIQELCAADFSLYEFALAKFDQRVQSLRRFAIAWRAAESTRFSTLSGRSSPKTKVENGIALENVIVRDLFHFRDRFPLGSEFMIAFQIKRHREICDAIAVLSIFDSCCRLVMACDRPVDFASEGGDTHELVWKLQANLGPGLYRLALSIRPRDEPDAMRFYLDTGVIAEFQLDQRARDPVVGYALLPSVLSIDEPARYRDNWTASIEVISVPESARAESFFKIEVSIHNTGLTPLCRESCECVNFSYHWYDESGEISTFDGIRTCLPRDVAPGERCCLEALILAPDTAGSFTLVLTLVRENVGWFDANNSEQIRVILQIL